MSNSLLKNIRKMRNDELVGLAKNRFLPEDLQLALIDTGYRNGHMRLMENSGLTKKARDLLWSDRVNSGYVNKSTLIANGFYIDEPDKYWELFKKYPSAFNRSPWRMLNTFVYSYNQETSWQAYAGLKRGANATPSELLNQIFDNYYSHDTHYSYGSGYQQRSFAEHPNCDIRLAIKISTCGHPEAERRAFEKIVELS